MRLVVAAFRTTFWCRLIRKSPPNDPQGVAARSSFALSSILNVVSLPDEHCLKGFGSLQLPLDQAFLSKVEKGRNSKLILLSDFGS